MLKIVRLLPLLCLPVLAAAQDPGADDWAEEEARLAKVFADGMARIVTDLNGGSFDAFVAAIDRDDMVERILGLRLIDGRIKRDFREDMVEGFAGLVESVFQAEAKDGIRAHLLVVESRADRGRAVVRFDLPYFQVNYIEYDLKLDAKERLVIVDWDNYLWGHTFSDHVGLQLVQAQPNKNAVRKLVDYPNVLEREVFQVMEVLKAARDRNFDRYFEIYDSLDEELRRQRPLLVAGLDATRIARKRRDQRRVLVAIDRYYPQDPLFALALLDYYFPDRQYEKALDALLRIKKTLGIDDAVSAARLSSATLVLDRIDEANAYADDAVAKEPGLELGWWALLRARVAAGRFDEALPALERLQAEFGHDLGPETLGKDPALGRFIASPEYRGWLETRPEKAAGG